MYMRDALMISAEIVTEIAKRDDSIIESILEDMDISDSYWAEITDTLEYYLEYNKKADKKNE